MKRYQGTREGCAAEVRVNGGVLNPRLDLWNHSPSGFEWGYGGSGPAQLALAILADHLRDDDKAVRLHQEFKSAIVVGLPYQGWTLTSLQIDKALEILTERTGSGRRTPRPRTGARETGWRIGL